MKQLEKIFKGLANRRRLSIIQLLYKNKELPVAEISRRIHLSFTSTSKHLLILHQLDIVEKRQESLSVYYRLGDKLPDVVKRVIFFISNSRE
ncbi:MAG: winged helix-turn-helix transcriptional regulator [Candidatus Liptonbacteria bacterium]|nr:winged helix-turn-helix transcriptional regulator [Candidatus Liptonbacteria bacterium]